MIVADASWVASLRDPDDVHHHAAVRSDETIGDEPVLLAAVTLAECLAAPAKMGVIDDAERALRNAFDVEEADDTAPRRWALRRAPSGLRLPDAIVLETAIRHQARGVATFDRRLAEACRAAGLVVVGID